MEGNFNIVGDTVEMTSGPVWSRELLIRLNKKQVHALRASVAWAQQQADHADDAHRADVLEKTVLAAVPQLEKPLRGIREKIQHEYDNHLAAWVTVLITLIMFIVTMNSQQGISGEQLEQILDETVRHVQSEQAQTVDAEPTTEVQPPRGPEEPPPATEIPTPKTR
ncbi:hypothetical protein [Microbacterium sp. NPDC080220]|uniref:hypothetical protein n=1 Tax=Microbacterium sp. NPDC080220 TaxID=3161017 RepID=UPI00342DE15F